MANSVDIWFEGQDIDYVNDWGLNADSDLLVVKRCRAIPIPHQHLRSWSFKGDFIVFVRQIAFDVLSRKCYPSGDGHLIVRQISQNVWPGVCHFQHDLVLRLARLQISVGRTYRLPMLATGKSSNISQAVLRDGCSACRERNRLPATPWLGSRFQDCKVTQIIFS